MQLLELEQYAAQIGLEHVLAELQLDCGLGDVARSVLGRVQIERVDVEQLAAGCQYVDLHELIGQILLQAAHAIAALTKLHRDLVVFDVGGDVGAGRCGIGDAGSGSATRRRAASEGSSLAAKGGTAIADMRLDIDCVCIHLTACARVQTPLPNHSALRIARPRLFAAGVTFSAYSLASMPLGNWMRQHSMPSTVNSRSEFLSGKLAGLIAIVGNQHALGAVALERGQVILGEALDPISLPSRCDSPHTRR